MPGFTSSTWSGAPHGVWRGGASRSSLSPSPRATKASRAMRSQDPLQFSQIWKEEVMPMLQFEDQPSGRGAGAKPRPQSGRFHPTTRLTRSDSIITMPSVQRKGTAPSRANTT
jgi:hypothetical protein